MDSVAAYQLLCDNLLLPPPILEIVQPALHDLGYPLVQSTTSDLTLNTLCYYKAESQEKNVVFLHIAGEVIGDPANFFAVANIADAFIGRTDGLFFFAPVKELDRKFNNLFAPGWQRKPNGPKKVRFFDQSDIDDLKAREPLQRKTFIVYLLDIDLLLPQRQPPNGGPPLDIRVCQPQLIKLLTEHAKTMTQGAGVQEYFQKLRNSLDFPDGWSWQPDNDIDNCAQTLISYLLDQGTYPPNSLNKQGYTTVGFLLEKLISRVGGDKTKAIYDMIITYKLIKRDDVLAELKKYGGN